MGEWKPVAWLCVISKIKILSKGFGEVISSSRDRCQVSQEFLGRNRI